MKKLFVIATLAVLLGCAVSKRKVKVKPPRQDRFTAILETGKRYRVPEYLPDYWEGLKAFISAARRKCTQNNKSCEELYREAKKSVLQAIEVTYLFREQPK